MHSDTVRFAFYLRDILTTSLCTTTDTEDPGQPIQSTLCPTAASAAPQPPSSLLMIHTNWFFQAAAPHTYSQNTSQITGGKRVASLQCPKPGRCASRPPKDKNQKYKLRQDASPDFLKAVSGNVTAAASRNSSPCLDWMNHSVIITEPPSR